MIEAHVQRARRAFFQFGSISACQRSKPNLYQLISGMLCLPSCALWRRKQNFMRTSLQKLQKFQSEMAKMAKRILKLPKGFSNTAAKIALRWHSMRSIYTIRKLKCLSGMKSTKVQTLGELRMRGTTNSWAGY